MKNSFRINLKYYYIRQKIKSATKTTKKLIILRMNFFENAMGSRIKNLLIMIDIRQKNGIISMNKHDYSSNMFISIIEKEN